VQQEGQGGGVHAPGEGQQHPLVTHLGTDIGNRLIDEGGRGPVGGAIKSAGLGTGESGAGSSGELDSAKPTDSC
jgi:hypothetical protein